ncbi:MAG: hypothetical protein IJP31_09065 [Lachnospiraceae bacterium]|nr:hypothetical protein [Lachnospiraceae bacterium]
MKKIKIRFIAWTLVLALLSGYGNTALAAEEQATGTVSGSDPVSVEQEVISSDETEILEEGEADSGNIEADDEDAAHRENTESDVNADDSEKADETSADVDEAEDDQETGAVQEEEDSTATSEENQAQDVDTDSENEMENETVSGNTVQADSISANSLEVGSVSAKYLTASSSYNYSPYWQGQGTISNLIIFIDFSDTVHEHTGSLAGTACYLTDQGVEDTFKYFDGSEAYPRGMRQYLYNISYGQLRVENIFPQYDGTKITPYTLPNTAEYYANHQDAMVAAVVEKVNASGQIKSNMNLDLEGADGVLDNLTILVACEEGNSNELFSGYKTTYGGNASINGKLVRDYNLINESGVYFGVSNSGLIIHEFLHTIGYPDLYHRNMTNGSPVSVWDIMASESHRVQYPLAYLRSAYTNWFTIDTVEKSGTGFSLYAASATTAATKNQQALILKTDYSDSEFFVVEYRKKGAAYTEEYEQILPGSGLIIYRVNTSVQGGNIAGPPDMIYVFRPGDTYNEAGYEDGLGNIYQSYLSSEAGRTSYGSSDFDATLEQGAITYSDGVNSGIVISNVGSAAGDQITFDITFTDRQEGEYWVTQAGESGSTNTTDIASWQNTDGSFYHILTRGTGSSASAALYKQTGDIFTELGNAPTGMYYQLTEYNGSLYTAYVDSGYYVQLSRWTGSSWTTVHRTSVQNYSGDFGLTADSQGVYLAYTDMNTVYVLKTTGSGITKLGSSAGTASYVAGISLSAEDGRLALLYRDFFNNNRAYIKEYNTASNSWSNVGSQSYSVGSGLIRINNNKLYLVNNGANSSGKAYLYVYDWKNPGSGWAQVGPGPFTNAGVYLSDLCFVGTEPYIVYTDGSSPHSTQVSHLHEGQWILRGDTVAKVNLTGLGIFAHGERLYVIYANNVTGKAFVRTNLAMNADSLLEQETVSVGEKTGDDGLVTEKYMTISEENRSEALTDAELIRLLERQKNKGEFQTITLIRTGNDDRDLVTEVSAGVWNAALALLGEEGELKIVLIDQTSGQEEVITWTFSGLTWTESALQLGILLENTAGKLNLTLEGDVFPAEQVSITVSSDLLAENYEALLQNSGKESLPLYYYEDTREGERLLKAQGDYQSFPGSGEYGENCRISIADIGELAAGTPYIIETSRYDWRLEYGVGVTAEEKTAGTISYYPSVDALYEALEALALENGAEILIDYKGETGPETIGSELLQYCADNGCYLEFAHPGEGDGLQYRWKFSGLTGTENYTDYPLELNILTEGAQLSAEFTEKTYIQILIGGNLPDCAEAQLTVYGVEETKDLINEPVVYQWNQKDGLPVLEEEARLDEEEGNWFTLTLTEGIGSYLLTAQTAYGWIPVRIATENGEETRMTYIEHRTGKKVTGWNTITGRKCYFDEEGYLAEGPVPVGKYIYLFGTYKEGNPGILTGSQILGDKVYYADSRGILQLGWQKVEGIWHYFDPETGEEMNSRIEDDSWAVVTTDEGEECFYLANGRTVAKGWKTINSRRYYFDEEGVLQTGFFTIGKNTFYGMENAAAGEGRGAILTGEQQIGTDTYYFGKNGVLVTGFMKLDGVWHFFSTAEKSPQKGRERTISGPEIRGKWYWYEVDGQRYCLLRNKTILTGWRTVDGKRYYFDPDTYTMQTGFLTVGTNTYYLEEREGQEKPTGALITGWITPEETNNTCYWSNSSGILQKGLQKIEGKWIYFDVVSGQLVKEISEAEIIDGFVTITDGQDEEKVFYLINNRTVAKGWRTINGVRYYFDTTTGERMTGLFQAGKHQYHYDENGTAKIGWWEDENGNCYYFKTGMAVTGWQTIEGDRYYFGSDGRMQTQMVTVGRGNYFLGTDGRMRTGFVRYCGSTYYFAANGKMVTGWQTLEGQRYYFAENGCMYTGWLKRGNYTYYLDEQLSVYGRMVKGKREIESFTYYFNEQGILQSYVPLN